VTLALERLSVDLGRIAALREVTLAFEPGRLTIVIGPNGAGKTTLLRGAAGLVRPSAGQVLLGGRAVAAMSASERARAIAYLPQGGTVAWPLPVHDVVALGRLPYGESPDRLSMEGRRCVEAALGALGLAGLENRPATALSGGERARVLVARALATAAPVLLADEPVAALDPRHQLVVLDVLRDRARAGATVVAVMHDLALAARFGDEIVLLNGGRLQARGRPADVFTPSRLAQSFGIEARVTVIGDDLVIAAQRPVA
jgi:iron complex transport system ATP-binding protein